MQADATGCPKRCAHPSPNDAQPRACDRASRYTKYGAPINATARPHSFERKGLRHVTFDLRPPHQAFSAGFYQGEQDFEVPSTLGSAAHGGADPGEVLQLAR